MSVKTGMIGFTQVPNAPNVTSSNVNGTLRKINGSMSAGNAGIMPFR